METPTLIAEKQCPQYNNVQIGAFGSFVAQVVGYSSATHHWPLHLRFLVVKVTLGPVSLFSISVSPVDFIPQIFTYLLFLSSNYLEFDNVFITSAASPETKSSCDGFIWVPSGFSLLSFIL
jgi:hypothetical protein